MKEKWMEQITEKNFKGNLFDFLRDLSLRLRVTFKQHIGGKHAAEETLHWF